MHTRDIPTDQWTSFLASFTRVHRGERADLEQIKPGRAGAETKLLDQPLVGVIASGECGRGACIEVIAGPEPEMQSHTIQEPSHVSVTELDDGHSLALQITADDGSITLLRFEPPGYSTEPPGIYLG